VRRRLSDGPTGVPARHTDHTRKEDEMYIGGGVLLLILVILLLIWLL
jgi:hypothetical protein